MPKAPSKRPLRRKVCGFCDQPLERAANGQCGRIWNCLPSGAPLPECFWVSAIRQHGPHGAQALSKRRRSETRYLGGDNR